MILEVAILNVKPGQEGSFEDAFAVAALLISAVDGYISHDLQRCLEIKNRYILLVRWRTLEDHTIGFRGSSEYEQWKTLLHHYYEPFPEVFHFARI